VVHSTFASGSTPLAVKLETMISWSISRDNLGCTSKDADDLCGFLTRVLVHLRKLKEHHNPDDLAKQFLTDSIKYCSALQLSYRKARGRSIWENSKKSGPHRQKPDPTFKPSHPHKTLASRVKRKRVPG
jgi:hypothetical protein